MGDQAQSGAREKPPALAYETPEALGRRGVLFWEGKLLVARDGVELPAVCVICGAEGTGGGIRLVFTWDDSFHVTKQKSTLELRRSGSVVAHLCGPHRRQWLAGRVVGAGGMIASGTLMLAGLTLAVVSESSDVPRWTGTGIEALLAGFAGMILFLFIFTLRTRLMACRKIEQGYIYLQGAGEGFARGIKIPDS